METDRLSCSHRARIEPILGLIRERAGLAFPSRRHEQVAVGIARAMARYGVADATAYPELVRRQAAAFDDLVDELTVGETYFFRDPQHFELIRRRVLPEIRRLRPPGHLPRSWSAGCASGEEAYSLAIVLLEEGFPSAVRILATDVSQRALAQARQAVFGPWSLRRKGGNGWVPRYFRPSGTEYLLVPWVRERVRFEYHNLARDSYPSTSTGIWDMDLILCRNVLIYFDSDGVAEVARRLYRTLAPGGWLITGPSDPPLAEHVPLETVVTPQGVFYRRSVGPCRPSPGRDAGARKADAAPAPLQIQASARPAPAPVRSIPETPPRFADPLTEARSALASGDSDRVLARLIFLPGISTARTVTEVSGRGVGLDVVREHIETLHGRIEVSSATVRGTELQLVVPLTLTTVRALLVVTGGQIFALASTNVRQLLRAAPQDLRSVEGRETLLFDGSPIPLVSLGACLGLGPSAPVPAGSKVPVVVLAAGAQQMAFVVDELMAEQEILVKSLGTRLRRLRHLAAATLLPDGRIALILNAAGLIRTALRLPSAPAPLHEKPGAERRPRRRLLVVDDSVTTRTLQKAALEAAGYEVLVASEGAEAWRTLQERPVDLVVTDVDMPRMDGFTLTEMIRRSRSLAALPVVLVTALESGVDWQL